MTTSTLTQAQADFINNILSSRDEFVELVVSPAKPDEDGEIVDGDIDTFDFHFNTAVQTWDAGVALVSSLIMISVDFLLLHEILDLVATVEHEPTASGMVVKVPASLKVEG